MAIAPFLAMTAAEMRNFSELPPKIAWMACHFSPYGLGLSNLPKALPPGSLLMVDDMTPPQGHDPVLIAEQLTLCAEILQCSGILLDYQKAGNEETAAIVRYLSEALPCPMAVSACYGEHLDCPVFLPPVPPSVPLEEYLLPWNNREIWLELGLAGEVLTLTEQSCDVTPLPCSDLHADGFSDAQLHCHYTIEVNENTARFTLWRTMDDWHYLLEKAGSFGITEMIGLYQELQ